MALLFRLSKSKYANSLTASGLANRWNYEGEFVIYTSSSRSLSTLEMCVHRAGILPSSEYRMMVIKIDNLEQSCQIVEESELPVKWRSVRAYSSLQKIGSEWYRAAEKLLLRIPSVIIPQEYNYVINTRHKSFDSNIDIEATEKYFWDARLLGK